MSSDAIETIYLTQMYSLLVQDLRVSWLLKRLPGLESTLVLSIVGEFSFVRLPLGDD